MLLLLQRARESGRCPPSMLSPIMGMGPDNFEMNLLNVMDHQNFCLASNAIVADAVIPILQSANTFANIPTPSPELRKYGLEQRRCLLLSVVGSTPTESPSLTRLLTTGYLSYVKKWLDEVLNGTVGGMDLLLHLLSSIAYLPVTKAVVKNSMMGKAIGAIEKHPICVNSPNEEAIKSRVSQVKDLWNKSVKARKVPAEAQPVVKRELETKAESNPVPAKKPKVSEETKSKRGPSVSTLIMRASATANGETRPSSSDISPPRKVKTEPASVPVKKQSVADPKEPKKSSQRVKWADHFGGQLSVASDGIIATEAAQVPTLDNGSDSSASWTDRKKRDRLREKELLAKVKKSKLTDDETDDISQPQPAHTKSTTPWRQPSSLQIRSDVTVAEVVSPEKAVQAQRRQSIPESAYFSANDVPDNPAPLSAIEVALDLTAQSSANTISIPFFVPQEQPSVPQQNTLNANLGIDMNNNFANANTTVATADFVQSLGLPPFLIGQNRQALETLAASPGLLATMVDPNGNYDQHRLLTLVQTLSSTQSPVAAAPNAFAAPAPLYPMGGTTNYGAPAPNSIYSAPSTLTASKLETLKNGYRGHSNSDGNLHVSGYGPSTTQADIINLFAPYVQVDEVVMKANFAFVNTSDPMNANIAKEALAGVLLGGLPIKINPAQRKAKDNNLVVYSKNGPVSGLNAAGPSLNMTPGLHQAPSPMFSSIPPFQPPPVAVPGPPPNTSMLQSIPQPPSMAAPGLDFDPDAVRDDRGNPATKNLFVAGYGAGTTEAQIRDIFSQAAHVIGVVLKGSFSFVNTSDKVQAIIARNALSGVDVNGAPLRINFAKETGRLGTSFDLTYNATSGPNAAKTIAVVPSKIPPPPPPPPNVSYYGHGF